MGYIRPPVTTDPRVLFNQAVAYFQQQQPNWIPHDGNLEIWTIMALAQMLAISRDVAALVPDDIFRYFGQSIMQLPPIVAQAATCKATITVQDTRGYTIPAGTQVAFQPTGTEIVVFQVYPAVTVLPGSSSIVGVSLIAVVPGVAGNGFAGPMQTINPLAFITTVEATTTSQGGVDPETSMAYLARLVEDLQLMTPRPILPKDFAALSQSLAGVYRAIAIDGYNASRTFTDGSTTLASSTLTSPTGAKFTQADEGRSINPSATIPSGTIILSVANATTATMSHNATGPSGVTAGQTVVLAAYANQERTVGVSAVDALGAAVSPIIQASLIAFLEAFREVNFIVTFIQPVYETINVVFTIRCAVSVRNTAAVLTAAEAAVTSFLSPATWGGGAQSPPYWDLGSNVVRYFAIAEVIGNVPGVAFVETLTVNGGTSDVTIAGVAALTEPGTVTGALA